MENDKIYRVIFSIKTNESSGIKIDINEFFLDKKCASYIRALTPGSPSERRIKYDSIGVLEVKKEMFDNSIRGHVYLQNIEDKHISHYTKLFEEEIQAKIDEMRSMLSFLENNIDKDKVKSIKKYYTWE